MRKRARQPLRILITDDHATTRLGIKQILKEEFAGAFFGEAADAAGTLRQLGASPWDLLILDISLPDRDGLSVLREVKERQPELPVLVFSVHPEDQFAMHAVKFRAAGYLSKERAPEELAGAVRRILGGGTYISSSFANRLASRLGARTLLPHEGLSNRKFEVLRRIAAGGSGKAIAAELGLSEKTVSTYRVRLLKKMGLRTTTDMVRYAIHHRLIDPASPDPATV
jgi:two-component system, NarL family, invasion response regulator UvrY